MPPIAATSKATFAASPFTTLADDSMAMPTQTNATRKTGAWGAVAPRLTALCGST
jgi:hypothetical protein